MVMLFDQQTAVEQYGDRREAEGAEKATAAAQAAATERDKRRVFKFHDMGMSPETIAESMELDLKLVKEWLATPSMA